MESDLTTPKAADALVWEAALEQIPTRFDPRDAAVFRYVDVVFDHGAPGSGPAAPVTVSFIYALEAADGSQLVACSETYSFPGPATAVPPARRAAFERLARHLGLAAGLSYYKLAAPGLIQIDDAFSPDGFFADEISFHRRLLAKGLGEFSFVNGLEPELAPGYSFRSAPPAAPLTGLNLTQGPLVPVGGGKDSCVTVEALRVSSAADPSLSPTLITVNRYPVIADVIADAQLPDIAVHRRLDPKLRALNELGALNGHVPATAIVSLAVLCTALLHGHGSVVMSNERSASEGNVEYRGVEINHQWSKSEESEAAIALLVAGIAPELSYFSLLRPLSELAIARRFAATCERYFGSFSSCNAAFRLDPARRTSRWCGQCPKCQFVYLALATALPRATLHDIWGGELFSSSAEDGFASLLGLREWKPFECVGEYGECRVALKMVMSNPEWVDHPVLGRLRRQLDAVGGWPTDLDERTVFSPGGSFIPDAYRSVLALATGAS